MRVLGIVAIVLGLTLVGTSVLSANEKSRSPFSRSPADVAKDEPCRFMGTFHKESRRRIEAFLDCDAISLVEWKCMAEALKALDDEMTLQCKQEPQSLDTIEARQGERYAACLPPSSEELVQCSLLSSDWACRERVCR